MTYLRTKYLILLLSAICSALLFSVAAWAQNPDSLVLKEQLLLHENTQYIRIAQGDGILSEAQADSLRKATFSVLEKPLPQAIDLLFQIRDYIDHGYEAQMEAVNETVMEDYYFSANRLLPATLGMPEGYVSPEEREAERQKRALEQLAESIARDFEREKLPPWQEWWIRHIPFFMGSRAWIKGTVTYINGHEITVPAGAPKE